MLDIIPITTKEQLTKLYENAKQDGHIPLYPTHILERDRNIVGFLSCNRIPILFLWTSKSCGPRDSYRALKRGEELLAEQGHRQPVILCGQKSPYYNYLPKLGYIDYGIMTVNLKV